MFSFSKKLISLNLFSPKNGDDVMALLGRRTTNAAMKMQG